jgi:hypothetical protein
MPNDCWNNVHLKGTETQIRAILTTELQDVPQWAFELRQVGTGAIHFKLWSPWTPCRDLLNKLFDHYEDIWLKNEWHEEGGHAGVIVGKKDELQEIEWDEGCIEEWHHRLKNGEQMPSPKLSDLASLSEEEDDD